MKGARGEAQEAPIVALLRVVLGALPGGWRAAALALASLTLADLAILGSVESALTGAPEGAALFRYLLLFVVGGLWAATEARALVGAMTRATNAAISTATREILRRVDALDLRGVERVNADRIHRRLTLETPLVAAAGVPLAASARYAARLLAAALYLLWVAPQVAVAVTLVLGLVGLLRYTGGGLAEDGLKAARALRDRLLERMSAIVRAASQVLLHRGRSGALLSEVEADAQGLAKQQKQVEAAALEAEAVASVLLYGLLGLVSVGLGALDLALAARVLVAVLFVVRAVNQLVVHLRSVQRAAAAFDGLRSLEEELSLAVAARPPAAEQVPIARFRSLGLSGVEFDYQSGDGFTFGPVDLRVEQGEILFITGRNGSGKSTALKLLLGLYPPRAGQLLLDDAPAPQPAPQAWRDLFSVVLSEFVLFERLSGPPVAAERARELLDWLALSDKVRIEDGRFSTLDLSTGQRKRLAMAVALLQDRPVFVFDEWAADQDPEFRDAYYRRILPDLKARGKTVICVTHDDQFFYLADRRVVLDAGRVVA